MGDPVDRVENRFEVFDVNDIRSSANYIFSYVKGRIRVKVRGLKGEKIPDTPQGDDGYYLVENGSLDGALANGWLCATESTTVNLASCPAKITWRNANNGWDGPVISVSTSGSCSKDRPCWDLRGDAGASIAPGIAFFVGDLDVTWGIYTNTFIATGDITVSNDKSSAVFAPNFAGYAGMSTVPSRGIDHAALGVCTSNPYDDAVRPTDFCGANNTYKSTALGNYALLAGSCNRYSGEGENRVCIEYVGGDIEVKTAVYGTIKAGNVFQTTGDGTSVVHGYISAVGQRGNTGLIHDLKGSTTIYLDPTDTYDPSGGLIVPGNGNGNGNETGTGSGSGSAVLRWSRYL